jgi:hypothetical protein
MTSEEIIISEDKLIDVFANANFGSISRRDVVKYALLKYAVGYHSGRTAKCILVELGLLTEKGNLTKSGRLYLWSAFYKNIDL